MPSTFVFALFRKTFPTLTNIWFIQIYLPGKKKIKNRLKGKKITECYSHNDPHNTHSKLRGKAGILPELQISLRNIYKVKWMSFIAWGCGCLLWGNEPEMICLFNLWNMWSCDHRSILNGVLMQWWGRKETGKSKALMRSLGKVKGGGDYHSISREDLLYLPKQYCSKK